MTERTLSFPNLEELSRAAAASIEDAAATAVRERQQFSLVLSGGSTPLRLYELLGSEWRDRIPWPRTHLFWADERLVPVDDPENNFGVARKLFVDSVPIPADNVHVVDTTVTDSTRVAKAYETDLRAHFQGESPSFDLSILGMGADGHTASLFPGYPLDSQNWVEAVIAPPYRPPRERNTLTLNALNGSRRVLFLIAGEDKRVAFENRTDLPAGKVRPREELIWLTSPHDHAIASASFLI